MILNFNSVDHIKPSFAIMCFEHFALNFSNAFLLLNLFCHENVYNNLFILCSANYGKLMDCITYTS